MILAELFKYYVGWAIINSGIEVTCALELSIYALYGFILLIDIFILFVIVSFIVKFLTKKTIFYWIDKIM